MYIEQKLSKPIENYNEVLFPNLTFKYNRFLKSLYDWIFLPKISFMTEDERNHQSILLMSAIHPNGAFSAL